MGTEIECKYRVASDQWRRLVNCPSVFILQGYLSRAKGRTVRVRVAGDAACITVKGASTGATRSEYEYSIPVADAMEMLDTLCDGPLIEKTRYRVPQEGVIFEIDEFAGDNAGLIVDEVELATEDQPITLPGWIGSEVTNDPRYFNSNLASVPFQSWTSQTT